MALRGKGVIVSEKEILEKFGADLSPRKNNIWGDPQESFVGDVDGKMCRTGYGIYWEAVARASRNWRESESFSNWKIEDLTREIKKGTPVIIWGVLPVTYLTDCSWRTMSGKYVLAFKQTHVRLAVGFMGEESSPSRIIINDPLSGRLFWPASYFLENWKTFGFSGVVIR